MILTNCQLIQDRKLLMQLNTIQLNKDNRFIKQIQYPNNIFKQLELFINDPKVKKMMNN